jgi:hypothetical protein
MQQGQRDVLVAVASVEGAIVAIVEAPPLLPVAWDAFVAPSAACEDRTAIKSSWEPSLSHVGSWILGLAPPRPL